MVVYYEIAGKKIGSHVLSMATLGSIFAGSFLATRGGGAPKKEQGPPVQGSSKEETDFITEFLKTADSGEKKAQH